MESQVFIVYFTSNLHTHQFWGKNLVSLALITMKVDASKILSKTLKSFLAFYCKSWSHVLEQTWTLGIGLCCLKKLTKYDFCIYTCTLDKNI